MTYEVNTNNYDEITKEGLVLVKLEAMWCGPCKALTPIYEGVSKELMIENSPVKLAKMDVDKNRDKAVELGVSSIPTILVYKNGEIVDRAIGMLQKPKLLELIEKNS
jgi:thioredoxin 1